MKNIFLAITALALVACGNSEKKENVSVETVKKETVNEKANQLPTENSGESFASFGEKITKEQTIPSDAMYEKYKDLEIGDTLEVKFASKVTEVCKKKGCFMKLRMPGEKEAMVKFKDYAFFVPKDIEEKEAIVSGKAYITVVSVERQRHFAEDAGKSEAEIAAITQPKKTLSFMADGVLIEE